MPRPSLPTPPGRVPPDLREAILAWFDARGRSISFRGARDPYAILVSEAMAQQTQVDRAAEAWGRFVAAFPTVEALAEASPAAVLRAWRGLGYNRRALNLQRAARVVVAEHAGRIPADLVALQTLPGVGPYTARAVLALAFGKRVGPVDTNVRRVLGRIVAGESGRLAPAALQALADEAAPADRPADWTGALMDLGATVCRSRAPRCGECPAARWCVFAKGYGVPVTEPGPDRARRRDPRAGSASEGRRFSSTSRWLRGRLMDLLRDTPGDGWAEIGGPIGDHPPHAVREALAGLVNEGLAEAHPDLPDRARLPLA